MSVSIDLDRAAARGHTGCTMQTPPTILELQEKRRANRDARGMVKNQALDWRLQDAERAEAIRLLGWKPETGPDDRYAATCGEMLSYLRERAG